MVNSLADGAAFFTGVAAHLELATKKKTEQAARIIRDEAKRVLGTYDYGWAPLSERTVAHKARGDTPGLETGKMRRSIGFYLSGTRLSWTAYIGSNDPKALWFELGTYRQPPRSFLRGAAMRKEKEVKKILGHDLFHSAFSHSPDFEDEWSYDGED